MVEGLVVVLVCIAVVIAYGAGRVAGQRTEADRRRAFDASNGWATRTISRQEIDRRFRKARL